MQTPSTNFNKAEIYLFIIFIRFVLDLECITQIYWVI